MTVDVAIVGGGLAGLACARHLAAQGLEPVVLEASDAVGGRVRTDRVDGFQIDRGFQVFLTAYPEARRVLDLDALDLRAFSPGALIRLGDGFERLGDPFRDPLSAIPTLLSEAATFGDKLRVLRLRQSVTRGSIEALWERPETSTAEALRDRYGFSDTIVERFFRPFLGGVFLDPSLATSSRAFEVYVRMFSCGQAAVPAAGMQAIPEQLARALPSGTVHLDTRVQSVEPRAVTCADGTVVACRAAVVATEAAEVPYLLSGFDAPPFRATVQIAWAAESSPLDVGVLMLDGEGTGPVNNVQVMSAVAPTYAPSGQALVTASVLGSPTRSDADLDAAARRQLRAWFGADVDGWRTLATHRVLHALPEAPTLQPPLRPARWVDGVYLAGDHRADPSINGALLSGRAAAEAVLADLAGTS